MVVADIFVITFFVFVAAESSRAVFFNKNGNLVQTRMFYWKIICTERGWRKMVKNRWSHQCFTERSFYTARTRCELVTSFNRDTKCRISSNPLSGTYGFKKMMMKTNRWSGKYFCLKCSFFIALSLMIQCSTCP